jgi:hypothetical protein
MLNVFQASGIASDCFVANLLQNMDNSPEYQYNIKWSAGTMYAGMWDDPSLVACFCLTYLNNSWYGDSK